MATSITALIAALHEATPEELSAILCELDRGMPLWQARQATAAATGTDAPPLLQVGTPHAADPVKPKRRAKKEKAAAADAASDSESATSSKGSRGRPRLTPEERAAREEAKLAARAAAVALREEAKIQKAAAKEVAAAEKAAAKAQKATEKTAAAAKKAASGGKKEKKA